MRIHVINDQSDMMKLIKWNGNYYYCVTYEQGDA